MYWTGSKDVKDLVARILRARKPEFKSKLVLDVPAGSGFTSGLLLDFGARVRSFDLFPEFFKEPRGQCEFADLQNSLPVEEAIADWIVFQEGIEHLPDQLKVLTEMNRALKPGGHLLLTTPNSSNLRSRLSHFLMESESLRVLPPNEVDSVWFSSHDSIHDSIHDSGRVYYGHIFSIGIQRLRVLSKLAGFDIITVHPARVNWTSFFIYLMYFPLIWWKLSSVRRRSIRKRKLKNSPSAYRELEKLGKSLNVLCSGHLILELRKVCEAKDVINKLSGTQLNFEQPT